MNIDENFVKGQYGSNRVVFWYFLLCPSFGKPGKWRDLRDIMV